jgi:hypothetical protein
MLKVDAVRKAIENLSAEEYAQLRQWFFDRDSEKWDREIEKDSKSGKLDFLIGEALNEKRQGKLKDF